MKYRARPVIVDASIIVQCGPTPGTTHINSDGGVQLSLQDGRTVLADKSMIARHIPEEGDYWVEQEDGYCYLNPKKVFERKYSPIV